MTQRAEPATIEASAGGWRRTQRTINVEAPVPLRVVLDEQWTQTIAPLWVPFGQPQLSIVANDKFGKALCTNGDGSFWSGVYTAHPFHIRRGLWIEAELSVPLTKFSLSQEQLLDLFTPTDSVIIESAAGATTLPIPRSYRHGESFKALVQILPDGRCGFALDGKRVYLTAPTYFDQTARVMLVGNTQQTSIRVGRVQVHEGVAPFIAW